MLEKGLSNKKGMKKHESWKGKKNRKRGKNGLLGKKEKPSKIAE